MAYEIVGGGGPATPVASEPATGAPLATQPQYEQSTSRPAPNNYGDGVNWTDTQKAAHAEADKLRAEALTNPGAHKRFKEAMAHAHDPANNPPPAWMFPKAPEANRPVSENELTGIEQAYEPASHPDQYQLRASDIPEGMFADPAEQKAVIADFQNWMMKLKLPTNTGREIIAAALRHASVARQFANATTGEWSTLLDNGQQIEHAAKAAEVMSALPGGEAKLRAEAQAYLDATLGPQGMAELKALMIQGDKISSIYYQPEIIWRLASLAKARGLVK